MRETVFFTRFGGFFYALGKDMLREIDEDRTEVLDFEVPDHWEEIRDGEGKLMEGCYRTIPAKMSDELE